LVFFMDEVTEKDLFQGVKIPKDIAEQITEIRKKYGWHSITINRDCDLSPVVPVQVVLKDDEVYFDLIPLTLMTCPPFMAFYNPKGSLILWIHPDDIKRMSQPLTLRDESMEIYKEIIDIYRKLEEGKKGEWDCV